jgi:2,3-bisphosphoglycerate-dependent phosphoglycerate mutase/probable phosphoglycerate mutase
MTLGRLLMLRHGETDFNTERRMQGQLDSTLTELGVAQSRAVAPLLAQRRPDRLLSSDLRRAADTADEVGLVCGLPVKLDARLRETHLGEWQGRTAADIEAAEPGVIARWRSDPTWAPPGGESRLEVVARALPVVTELAAELADSDRDGGAATVLLCGHSGVFAGLTAALLGLPEANWPVISGLGNCRWAELTRRDGRSRWRLTGHNLGP